MKIFKGNRRRILKDRRAMELSINFIVMLIIAIVMFGFGLRFLSTFFAGGMKMQKALDDQTKRNIENLLSADRRVAIPLDNKEILRGQQELVGMGILNVMSNGTSDEFSIKVDCVSQNCQTKPPVVTYDAKAIVPNNKQAMIQIFFNVPKTTPPGTYIYNICVARNKIINSCQNGAFSINDLYAGLQKLYIKVP